jgi:hypothetical protein
MSRPFFLKNRPLSFLFASNKDQRPKAPFKFYFRSLIFFSVLNRPKTLKNDFDIKRFLKVQGLLKA